MYKNYGTSPGSTIYTGDVATQPPIIKNRCYNTVSYDEVDADELIKECKETGRICWSHIEPISDAVYIRRICDKIGLHPLTSEDILSIYHRPKVDEYDDYLFIILDAIEYVDGELDFNHISFVIRQNCLFSFSDQPVDFSPIIRRIEKSTGRVRKRDAGYLFFALADLVVDHYFEVLEKIGEEIDVLEEDILSDPDKKSVERIHYLKRALIQIRHSIWPLREIINTMMHSDLVNEENHPYFKDLYDHTIQILDTVERFRDTVAGFLDIYLSTLSNHMNEIMKTLSIIATIFIPLSFITGYFGMNFKYETILESESSYMWSNISMIAVPVVMLLYFKIRRWF